MNQFEGIRRGNQLSCASFVTTNQVSKQFWLTQTIPGKNSSFVVDVNYQLIFVLSGNNGGAAADTAQIEADIADLQTKVDTLEMTTVPDAITQITNVETSAAANCQKLLEVTAELPAVADPVC